MGVTAPKLFEVCSCIFTRADQLHPPAFVQGSQMIKISLNRSDRVVVVLHISALSLHVVDHHYHQLHLESVELSSVPLRPFQVYPVFRNIYLVYLDV